MNIQELVQSVQSLNADDAFPLRLSPDQWTVLGRYLTPHELRAGDLLIKQGDADRTVYLLERGSLQVFTTGGAPGASRIAILRAGSIIGEPGLFIDATRTANVEAMTPCVVWALRGPRFDELSARSPLIALEVLRAAGAVMAMRMRANLLRHTPIS